MNVNCIVPAIWHEAAHKNHGWMIWRFHIFYELLKDMKVPLRKKLKVLDVGCGKGVLIDQLNKFTNWEICGEDINNKKLSKRKMANVSREKNKFDVIILFDVLEHIAHPRKTIQSVVRKLKKDGLIFINVPAMPFLYSNYDKAVGHYRRYDKNSLINEFRPFDLKVMMISSWGFMLLPLLILRKLLLLQNKNPDKIISIGFKERNKLVKILLQILMKIELYFIKHSFIGSSIIMCLKKQYI